MWMPDTNNIVFQQILHANSRLTFIRHVSNIEFNLSSHNEFVGYCYLKLFLKSQTIVWYASYFTARSVFLVEINNA